MTLQSYELIMNIKKNLKFLLIIVGCITHLNYAFGKCDDKNGEENTIKWKGDALFIRV